MDTHSTGKLFGGALIGAIVTAAAEVIFGCLGIPSGPYAHAAIQGAAPIAVAACVLFPRPILLRTVLRSRRDPLLFDEDLNAMLIGRAFGMVVGFPIGIALCSKIF
ncbi:hypothetical protein FAZ95_25835 [Trinickia violacea]|uniref:Uncharacterized protein n=1 Tax=Trinickia violacea TaxID=2571746 RepID=A0A4P8IU32_9BURK|nr:hypothetical protein [Trinickia violacea]QCP52582.1 hypothetical protein FAZ95_25835 [Trinickia violacea]